MAQGRLERRRAGRAGKRSATPSFYEEADMAVTKAARAKPKRRLLPEILTDPEVLALMREHETMDR